MIYQGMKPTGKSCTDADMLYVETSQRFVGAWLQPASDLDDARRIVKILAEKYKVAPGSLYCTESGEWYK